MITIVVAGDLIWDFNLVQYPIVPATHHEPLRSTLLDIRAGGAWYLKGLIDLSCSDMAARRLLEPSRQDDPCLSAQTRVNQAYQIWALHEKTTGNKEQVWRISQFLGCHLAGEGTQPIAIAEDVADPEVLVLDDLRLGFCENEENWPAALGKNGKPKRIILKASCLPASPLWKRLLELHADRLTVVLSVELLRMRGAAISRALSWDRTIEETINEFDNGASSRDLARCRRVIVHFGCAGAASFSRCSSRLRNTLDSADCVTERANFEIFVYNPIELEGVWKSNCPGITFGASSILTAAMARHEVRPEDYPLFVALGRGLAAIRVNHELGAGQSGNFNATAASEQTKATFHPNDSGNSKDPATSYFGAFPHTILADELRKNHPAIKSDLLQDLTGVGYEYVAAKAAEIVIWGLDQALRAAPKAKYGKYVTVDREEIERINAIRNLIVTYQSNPDDLRPLSIAVFGAPGSGKSFAIKQLAGELFGGRKAVLDFNLSQILSDDQLKEAFHQVRDASVQGKIPLVFWDEFDTEKITWLKHFLEPMQDAQFRSGSVTHPFGKAIFIFAGGTCSSFEAFDKSRGAGADAVDFREKERSGFCQQASRLRKHQRPQSLQ